MVPKGEPVDISKVVYIASRFRRAKKSRHGIGESLPTILAPTLTTEEEEESGRRQNRRLSIP